jgi:hypothetical protein
MSHPLEKFLNPAYVLPVGLPEAIGLVLKEREELLGPVLSRLRLNMEILANVGVIKFIAGSESIVELRFICGCWFVHGPLTIALPAGQGIRCPIHGVSE